MANIVNEKNGCKRIQFVAPCGKRKTIRLGKIDKRGAESIKYRVESLLTAAITGSMDRDTAVWVSTLTETSPELKRKLAAAGLIEGEKPKKQCPTLREHLADYLRRHSPRVKPATIDVWKQVMGNLETHFPAEIRMDEITTGHAKAFLEWLRAKKMRPTTIYKRMQFARQFFNDAVDWEIIPRNPFAKVKTPPSSAKANVDVPLETIEKLMPKLETTWRTIVALSRYGGLRCPSEVLSLRWADVDLDAMRMSIPEPKVEHHEGRGMRSCPIFARLYPILKAAKDQAPEGAEFVVDMPAYRAKDGEPWKNSNLRTQFLKRLKKAGIAPWSRLFHSMRASCQTELERQHPRHVVCAWLGNSEAVAKKSYLLVTDADYDQATKGGAQCGALPPEKVRRGGAESVALRVNRNEARLRIYKGKREKTQERDAFLSGGQGIRTLNRLPGA